MSVFLGVHPFVVGHPFVVHPFVWGALLHAWAYWFVEGCIHSCRGKHAHRKGSLVEGVVPQQKCMPSPAKLLNMGDWGSLPSSAQVLLVLSI